VGPAGHRGGGDAERGLLRAAPPPRLPAHARAAARVRAGAAPPAASPLRPAPPALAGTLPCMYTRLWLTAWRYWSHGPLEQHLWHAGTLDFPIRTRAGAPHHATGGRAAGQRDACNGRARRPPHAARPSRRRARAQAHAAGVSACSVHWGSDGTRGWPPPGPCTRRPTHGRAAAGRRTQPSPPAAPLRLHAATRPRPPRRVRPAPPARVPRMQSPAMWPHCSGSPGMRP